MIKPLDRTGTWRTYSVADGLPGVRIEHIAEDSQGYIWFATRDNGASALTGTSSRRLPNKTGFVVTGFFLFTETVRSGCGLPQGMASVGTMAPLSTLWRATAFQAAAWNFSMKTDRAVYGVVARVLWDIMTARLSTT